jgi:hypothetical protein
MTTGNTLPNIVPTTVSNPPVPTTVSNPPVPTTVSKTPVTGAGEIFHLKAYAYDHRFFHSELYHINGLPFRVDFRDGTDCPFYRPAEYRTTDPLIQQAIESHPSFGPDVRITRINPTCKYCINPLPKDFPRTPPPPPAPRSNPPVTGAPAPRSKTPEGCVTGACSETPVTGAGAGAQGLGLTITETIALALAHNIAVGHLQFTRPRYLPPHLLPPSRMPAHIRHATSHALRSKPPVTENSSLPAPPPPARPPPPLLAVSPSPLGVPLCHRCTRDSELVSPARAGLTPAPPRHAQ